MLQYHSMNNNLIVFYPTIDPVIVSIGTWSLHWYAIMYLIGFLAAWLLARYRVKKNALNWSSDQIADLIFYSAIGVILGGRIGYMLFYNFTALWHTPWQILKIWEGGMSFHGGFLGVLAGLYFFGRKYKLSFFDITDFVAPLIPIGLGAGRIGNFINGELCGRPTGSEHWGMIYPFLDATPRHPSQLYEFFFEGIVLFIILWLYTKKPRPLRATSGLFLVCYGTFRFILEFFREPDIGLGYIWDNWLTMGQLLSLPMIILGIFLLFFAYRGQHARLS